MAFHPQQGGDDAVKECGLSNERVESCYDASSPRGSDSEPPPAQMMDRHFDVSIREGDGRIPAAVFERETPEANQDWSMMSTESVFTLQVAPSCDFTGYFLAHPELMDMSTPPRTNTVSTNPGPMGTSRSDRILDLGDATLSSTYSFAFPDLTLDKRYSTKKSQVHDKQPHPMVEATSTSTEMVKTETAEVEAPHPPPVEEKASKQEATPEKVEGKGGLLSCLPCWSS